MEQKTAAAITCRPRCVRHRDRNEIPACKNQQSAHGPSAQRTSSLPLRFGREDHSDLLLLLTLCNLCSISAERALAAFCVLSDRPLAAISIARGGSFWHIHAGTGIPGRRDSQRMGNPFRCGICQDRLLAAT